MPPAPVLRTDWLAVTPVTLDDAPALYEVLADPAVGWWTGDAAHVDVDEVRARIRGWTEHEPADERWCNWIVRRHDGEPVGYVQATI